MAKTLLLVDDELPTLRALQRVFKRTDIEVLIACTGSEALAMLAQQPVQVILSDFRMPQMSGDKLLAQVRQLYPDTVRMALSGFADLNMVMDALNDGAVFKFLVKPWDNDEMVARVNEAFDYWQQTQREHAATRLINSSHELIFDLDESGRVVQLTSQAASYCQLDPIDVIGQPLDQLLAGLDEERFLTLLTDHGVLHLRHESEQLELHCSRSANGHFTVQLIPETAGPDHWALGLNGLYQRDSGLRQLNRLLEQNQELAIICLHLERYQSFQESLSFSELDQLLTQVSHLILGLPGCELLMLVGEGEFLLVMPSDSEQQCSHLIERVLSLFDQPVPFAGREAFLAFYGGYSLAPADSNNAESLVHKAQTAARHSSQRGSYFYPRYRRSMKPDNRDELELQNDLYRALERNELYVEYQPKLNAVTGRITGAEALLRWQHHARGRISPAEFIPLAEANGLIEPIGQWVLSTAVTQSRFWHQEGMTRFNMAVNLSGRQLQQQQLLVDQVQDILRQTGMPARSLELEVTWAWTSSPITISHSPVSPLMRFSGLFHNLFNIT